MSVRYYAIAPVPKPRQTQADKWKVGRKARPAVARYRAFADTVRRERVRVDNYNAVVFVVAMPKSWTKRKRLESLHRPHTQRPDKDNLEKALLDAIYGEDCHIWYTATAKFWGETGGIFVFDRIYELGTSPDETFVPFPAAYWREHAV